MRMRSGWKNTPAEYQPLPADNTEEYVDQQIAEWQRTGTLIHPEIAMEIAAWYHAPDSPFSALSHQCLIVEGLWEEIEDLRTGGGIDDNRFMSALQAYVEACEVTVWVVGSNIAGYVPESDIFPFLDYAEAVSEYREMVSRIPDEVCGDDSDDCTCEDGGELCGFHSLEGEIAAHLQDVPTVTCGRVFTDAVPVSISIRPDDKPLPTVYWLSKSTRVMSEYLAERDASFQLATD